MGVLGGETQGAQGHKGNHETAHRTVTSFGHRHTCPQNGRGKLLTFGIPVERLCFGLQHRLTCWVGGSGRAGHWDLVVPPLRSQTHFLPAQDISIKTPQLSPSPALERLERGGVTRRSDSQPPFCP